MKRNIEESYIEHCCKECENKVNTIDLCHLVVIRDKDIQRARCVWYKNSKRKRDRRVREYEKMY